MRVKAFKTAYPNGLKKETDGSITETKIKGKKEEKRKERKMHW